MDHTPICGHLIKVTFWLCSFRKEGVCATYPVLTVNGRVICQLHSRLLKPLNLSLVLVHLAFIYLTSPSLVLLSPTKNWEQPSLSW